MITTRYRELRAELRELEREHEAQGFGFAKRWSNADRSRARQLVQLLDAELDNIDELAYSYLTG